MWKLSDIVQLEISYVIILLATIPRPWLDNNLHISFLPFVCHYKQLPHIVNLSMGHLQYSYHKKTFCKFHHSSHFNMN